MELRQVLFWFLVVSNIFFVVRIFRNSKYIYEFPGLFSLCSFVFIVPTLFAIRNFDTISDSIYNRYVINALLCFWCGIAGYYFGIRNIIIKQTFKDNPPKYNYDKIINILSIYIFIGGVASIFINPKNFGQELGGTFAIILFFSRLLRPAALIIICFYLIKQKKFPLFLLLIWAFFAIQFIVISGRRSETFISALIVIFPLFFIKKVQISRPLLLPITILAIGIVVLFPIYRQYTRAGQFSELSNVSAREMFSNQLEGQRTNEVIESAYNMDVVAKSGEFNYGTSFVNGLINQFVSSTIFGKDAKQSLLLEGQDLAQMRSSYLLYSDDIGYKFYLTPTGFGNAFLEFGFFGCLMFAILGYLSCYLYKKAIYQNAVEPKVLYCMFAIMILFSVYDSIPSLVVYFLPYLFVYLHVFKFSNTVIKSSSIKR